MVTLCMLQVMQEQESLAVSLRQLGEQGAPAREGGEVQRILPFHQMEALSTSEEEARGQTLEYSWSNLPNAA